ncbi:MAG: nitroreductase family deazaflavin-dependent oxidoreductase [Candidatus Thermofonsia bacterium]|nr:MAG: nitroreductase family deazaflavin-dependent oxidoreductase [Candidatus Thermofonsia bacterium]
MRGALLQFLAWKPVSLVLARLMHWLDKLVYRWSNGRFSATSLVAGLPLIMVTTIGAKSGQPRTMPLLGIPFDDKLGVIASNWGGQKHPAWYYNMKANPHVQVSVNGRTEKYTAREIFGKEKEAVWETAVRIYPGYNAYQARANRPIPVLLLEKARS